MIETEEALQDIEEIAKQCDVLCIGLNDLTASLLKLSRSQRGQTYDGVDPFLYLAEDVAAPLEEAIKRARKANPNIIINVCGDQIAGHDIASIERVLRMGVDQITVAPFPDNFFRARLAVAQYEARRKLGLGPIYGAKKPPVLSGTFKPPPATP
jgi:phosphoenolpyruvate-protein kinase (PTS system EI component)